MRNWNDKRPQSSLNTSRKILNERIWMVCVCNRQSLIMKTTRPQTKNKTCKTIGTPDPAEGLLLFMKTKSSPEACPLEVCSSLTQFFKQPHQLWHAQEKKTANQTGLFKLLNGDPQFWQTYLLTSG
jgi:hypothetical protein